MTEIPPYTHTAKYYETDQMAIVHHSNYIRWFEEARVYYLTQAGFPYSKMEELGVLTPVLSAECTYRKPVRFDETVVITPAVESYNGFRMAIVYKVTDQQGELRAEGRTTHCFVDRDMKPVRVKRDFPAINQIFEELAAMYK